MHAVVSSPLRCAVMAIMRAILKTPTRWRRLSENPILQNRYPIMVKCLNIGKNIGKSIYRSISNYDYMTAIRMLSMTGYYWWYGPSVWLSSVWTHISVWLLTAISVNVWQYQFMSGSAEYWVCRLLNTKQILSFFFFFFITQIILIVF